MQQHNTVVLGASGLVGQRMQQRLANHPWFRLAAVVGSKRTAGKKLESIDWNLQEARPNLPNLTVLSAEDEHLVERLKEGNITVAFSCLPAAIADPLELMLASSGIAVFSNASAFRRCDGVPLVIPDVNPTHLDQFDAADYTLACATNCTLIPLAVPVAALSREFGITHVTMNSEQALSGAGYELVLSQTALAGEHASEIEGEAEKTAAELLHVLGDAVEGRRASGGKQAVQQTHPAFNESKKHVNAASFEVEVNCKRVTRIDGHQIFATVRLKHEATEDKVLACFQKWSLPPSLQACPSAPKQSMHLVDKIDENAHLWSDGVLFSSQPNPSEDLKAGMAVVVGSVVMIDPTTVEFSAYSHNTVRGAAGGTMWLAEQAYTERRLPKQQ